MRAAVGLLASAALAVVFVPSARAGPCPVTYKPALGRVPAKVPALRPHNLPPLKRWVAVTATFYGPGADAQGAFHVNRRALNKRPFPCSFAELSTPRTNRPGVIHDYAAMGGLPDGTMMAVYCPRTRQRVMLVKRDVGQGGPGIGSLQRAFDFWNPGTSRSSAAIWCGAAGIFKIYIMRLPAMAAGNGLQPDYGARARWDGQSVPKHRRAAPKKPAAAANSADPSPSAALPAQPGAEPIASATLPKPPAGPDYALIAIGITIVVLFLTRPKKH